MNEHVIDRPELQPPVQRAFFDALTVILWMSYAYLLLPLATLIAWYAGFTAVYEEMVMRRGWEALVHLLRWYAFIVLIMGLTQVGWASINWARFRGKRDRRRLRERHVEMDVEKMFDMQSIDFPKWQSAKRLVVQHHPTVSKIVSVEASRIHGEDRRAKEKVRNENPHPRVPPFTVHRSPVLRGENCMSENG